MYISVFFCLCLPDWRINVFINQGRIQQLVRDGDWTGDLGNGQVTRVESQDFVGGLTTLHYKSKMAADAMLDFR